MLKKNRKTKEREFFEKMQVRNDKFIEVRYRDDLNSGKGEIEVFVYDNTSLGGASETEMQGVRDEIDKIQKDLNVAGLDYKFIFR